MESWEYPLEPLGDGPIPFLGDGYDRDELDAPPFRSIFFSFDFLSLKGKWEIKLLKTEKVFFLTVAMMYVIQTLAIFSFTSKTLIKTKQFNFIF